MPLLETKNTSLPRKFPKEEPKISKNGQILHRDDPRNFFQTYQFDILVRISYPDVPDKIDFPKNLSESRYKSDPGPETITIIIFMIHLTIQHPARDPSP